MIPLNLNGTIFGLSGYDNHCKGLFNSIYNTKECDIFLDSPKPIGWESFSNDQELSMLSTNRKSNAINLTVNLPMYYPIFMQNNDKAFIGFVVWEGSKTPLYWRKYLIDPRVNLLFTPSKHTKDAIITSCPEVEDKIRVINHGVDINLFKKQEVERSDKFTFVANKGWVRGLDDRGGLQFVFKAFSEEFRAHERVELFAKINPAYNVQPLNLDQELFNLNLPENRALMKISMEALHLKALPSVYSMGDVFVSATMCESFGLPGLEAMSCSLVNIQTGYGGQLEYLNEKNGWIIDYDLVYSKELPSYEGIQWAQPRIKHLRELMRYCFDNQDEARKKGLIARQTAEEFTWDKSAQDCVKSFKELI